MVGGVGWGFILGFGDVGGRRGSRKGGRGKGDVRGELAIWREKGAGVCEVKRVVCCGVRTLWGSAILPFFL